MCKLTARDVNLVEAQGTENTIYSDQEFFVDAVDKTPASHSAWMVLMHVNGIVTNLKLDTGANVNIISHQDFLQLKKRPKLHPTKVKLTAYAGSDVPVAGQCILQITYKDRMYNVSFIVTSAKVQPILGVKDCERLNLVKRVWAVTGEPGLQGSGIERGFGEKQPEYYDSEVQTLPVDKTKVLESVSVVNGVTSYDTLLSEFSDLFEGLGCLPGDHGITVDENVTPVVEPCRKISFVLYDKLKVELNRMEKSDVIEKVVEPSEWVSGLVVVHKKNGNLRVCLDPRNLNAAIRREHFKLPTREEVMSQFAGAKVLSKLDAKSGFWQLKLTPSSSRLCTFTTPFGRYRFKRLPFGIKSAPEVYHRTLHGIFEDLPGVDTSMDDIIIWGETTEIHDRRLRAVLQRCREVNLKLNSAKCKLGVPELTFLGDVVSAEGLKADPEKVRAIDEMEKPQNVKELQRFLGMVNYLSRFVQDLSTKAAPLRALLDKKNEWCWSNEQEHSWLGLKNSLKADPVLQFFDPNKPIRVSSDASKSGLGAVLLQQHDDKWLPVAYASRAMTEAECRYAQIEKETLAIVFACTRFDQYLYAQTFNIETDHKPLVAIFSKALNDCPPRIQRLRLKLQRYDFKLSYTLGKAMFVADELSRNFSKSAVPDSNTEEDVRVYVDSLIAAAQVTNKRLDEIREKTKDDSTLKQLSDIVLNGWPSERQKCPPEVRDYWNYRDELSVINSVVFKGTKIVIPEALRPEMLQKVHVGHLGQEKCKKRARQVIFWPKINQDIDRMVVSCNTCLTYRDRQTPEPLLPHPVVKGPWEKVASDLFEFDKKQYLLIVD